MSFLSFSQATVVWSNFPSGVAVALDQSDNVYTAYWDNNPAGDISIVKRNSSGEIVWEVAYNNTDPTLNEAATWIETDSQGNVLVSGSVRSGFSNPVSVNSILMKYDSSGNLLWRVVYETNFDGSSTRKCLIDANDDIYVLGLGMGNNGLVTTIKKFSSTGQSLMTYFDSGNGGPFNFKFTPDNHIIVMHRASVGSTNSYSKISSTGTFMWNTGGINSLSSGDACGDAFGNTYTINGLSSGSILTKLSPTGAVIWSRINNIIGTRVEVDGQNNPIIGGSPDVGYGVAFIKYDTEGNVLWQNLDADGPSFSLLAHAQMKIDTQNAVYLTGGTMSQMAVCKVDNNGASAWTLATSSGYPVDFDFGSDNSVYVTGGTTARISQGALSVDNSEISVITLKTAPNPCENWLEIEGLDDIVAYTIVDISGRIIFQNNLTSQQINVSDLSSGIYQLLVYEGTGSVYQTKFVKK